MKTTSTDLKEKSAKIIQKTFRDYLHRKSTTISSEKESHPPSERPAQISEIKVQQSRNSTYITNLIAENEKILNKLKSINNLNSLEAFGFAKSQNSEIIELAKEKHLKKLKQYTLQWWEKL